MYFATGYDWLGDQAHRSTWAIPQQGIAEPHNINSVSVRVNRLLREAFVCAVRGHPEIHENRVVPSTSRSSFVSRAR